MKHGGDLRVLAIDSEHYPEWMKYGGLTLGGEGYFSPLWASSASRMALSQVIHGVGIMTGARQSSAWAFAQASIRECT